jgi:hypothetical protein
VACSQNEYLRIGWGLGLQIRFEQKRTKLTKSLAGSPLSGPGKPPYELCDLMCRPGGKSELIANQHQAVSSFPAAETVYRVVYFRHREGLSNRRYAMPRAELQHRVDASGTSRG